MMEVKEQPRQKKQLPVLLVNSLEVEESRRKARVV
jgi:hypothetical protein